MTFSGHRLPATFLRAVASGAFRREVGSWHLRSNRDAAGRPLETELAKLYENRPDIESATANLMDGFKPNGLYGESLPALAGPGAIPDIVDFAGVICFGMSGDGAPFCFDYRGGGEPRVIWWDDVYWRMIAPNFSCFMELFELPEVWAYTWANTAK